MTRDEREVPMETPPRRRQCPGCESAMSEVRVDGAPVSFCGFCGGAWIGGDELREVARRELAWAPFEGGGTTRRCVDCTLTMDTGLLEATPVERCRLCAGFYLDPGELDEVAARRLTIERPQPARPRHEHTFRCPRCSEEFPLVEGTATGRGMACLPCAPMFDGSSNVLPPSKRPIFWSDGLPSDHGELLRSTADALFVLDIVGDLLG